MPTSKTDKCVSFGLECTSSTTLTGAIFAVHYFPRCDVCFKKRQHKSHRTASLCWPHSSLCCIRTNTPVRSLLKSPAAPTTSQPGHNSEDARIQQRVSRCNPILQTLQNTLWICRVCSWGWGHAVFLFFSTLVTVFKSTFIGCMFLWVFYKSTCL